MSNKSHLTISKEPEGLPTLCPFPLKLNILWMTPSSSPGLGVKLPELLLGAPLRGFLVFVCPNSQPPANSSEAGVTGSFHLAGGLVWAGLVPASVLQARVWSRGRKVCGRGMWGSGDRHVRSNFQIRCGSFSEAGLGLTLPVTFLHRSSTWNPGWAHGACAPQGTMCADLGGVRNKGWIWLTLTVLAFRLPLHVSEISMSVNISVLQRRYYLCCIICEKSLPQNLICGSINLKNLSECSVCLLNKEQMIVEDSHPYHFVLLFSLWEEHKGAWSLFLTLSLAKV